MTRLILKYLPQAITRYRIGIKYNTTAPILSKITKKVDNQGTVQLNVLKDKQITVNNSM